MSNLEIRILCVLFFLFIVLSGYSQKEFYHGYVITYKGDTIHGKIHYKETDYSPRKISFQNQADTLNYTTSSLKEFMLVRADNDTVIFRKAIVTYAAAKARLVELTVSDSRLLIRDTVFLELVMDGTLKLYLLKNYSFRNHYYIQTSSDSAVEELVYRKYYAPHEDLPTAVVMKYKFQLLRAMKNCARTKKVIEDMRYNEKELRKVFAEYNTCFGENRISYTRKPEKIKFFFTAFGGFNSVWVKFPASGEDAKSRLIRGNGYAAGIGFNVQMSRDMPKFWINSEIGINDFSIRGTTPTYYSNFSFHKDSIGIHLLHLKLRVLPTYYFGRSYSKVVPYLNGGFSVGFLLKAFENKRYFKNQPNRNEPAVANVKGYDLGFAVSFGLRILKYAGIEARYEFGDGFSYTKTQGAETHSLMLTARVNIGEKIVKKPL